LSLGCTLKKHAHGGYSNDATGFPKLASGHETQDKRYIGCGGFGVGLGRIATPPCVGIGVNNEEIGQ
jgi:hypothetical protein